MATKNEHTESFNENYQKLKDIAETLRNQSEPDIDALIPMVENATQAYKHCKERLDSVKLALKEHLPDAFPDEPDS